MADLEKYNPSVNDNDKIIHASKEWFHNFKARTGVHGTTKHGKAANADKRAAENCIHHFEMMTQKIAFALISFQM